MACIVGRERTLQAYERVWLMASKLDVPSLNTAVVMRLIDFHTIPERDNSANAELCRWMMKSDTDDTACK